jgi:nitrile hydratase
MTSPSDPEFRARALEALLIGKGLITEAAIDDRIALFNQRVGPMNGARVVARAWVDAAFKAALLRDASTAIAPYKFVGGQIDKLVVVENTLAVHNVVVCTLCSCYPWAVMGLPPNWYKDPAYRSRVVREPRRVLAEFGLKLDPGREVRVWDSSAEVRYMVLPMMPARLAAVDEATRIAAVHRDTLIGVAEVI